MKLEKQLEVADTLLRYIETRSTHLAEMTFERDSKAYYDELWHQREKEIFFRRTPLLAGLSSDLKNPGDFLANEDSGTPILIIRQEDGSLAAFANICRHRGSRLVDEPRGTLRRGLACPYHGWCYSRSGDLVAVPYEEGFAGLDRSQRGLLAMPVAEKYGLVFICGDRNAVIDVDEHLGPLAEELASWNFGDSTYVCTRGMETEINWKLALDTFAEGYHFSVLHKSSIAHLTHTNVMAYERLGRHYRLAYPARDIESLRAKKREDWDPTEYMSFVYYLFPNVSMNVTGGKNRTFRTFRITPGNSARQSRTVHTAYTVRPFRSAFHKELFDEHFKQMHDVIVAEDYTVQARAQQSMHADLPTSLLFGRNEPSLIDMHRQFDELIGAASPDFPARPASA